MAYLAESKVFNRQKTDQKMEEQTSVFDEWDALLRDKRFLTSFAADKFHQQWLSLSFDDGEMNKCYENFTPIL